MYSLCRFVYFFVLFDIVFGFIMVYRFGGCIEYIFMCVFKGCFFLLKEIKSKINIGYSI